MLHSVCSSSQMSKWRSKKYNKHNSVIIQDHESSHLRAVTGNLCTLIIYSKTKFIELGALFLQRLFDACQALFVLSVWKIIKVLYLVLLELDWNLEVMEYMLIWSCSTYCKISVHAPGGVPLTLLIILSYLEPFWLNLEQWQVSQSSNP